MANQTIFKRYEYKYLLTADQKKELTRLFLKVKRAASIRLRIHATPSFMINILFQSGQASP